MSPELETSFLGQNLRDRDYVPRVGGLLHWRVCSLADDHTDRPDTPSPFTHGDVPTRRAQTSKTNYNRLGHSFSHSNQHQPYPLMASVIAHTDVNQHCNERFGDLYTMDKVWAAKRIWRERIKSVEVTPFQEAMLEASLWDFHEMADQMPGCADVPIGFALVMAGECFESIEQLTDDVIHNDLLVRRLLVQHLVLN